MLKTLWLTMIAMASCANPTYTTSHGVYVYDPELLTHPHTVEVTIDWALANVPEMDRDVLRGVEIHVQGTVIECTQSKLGCRGLFQGRPVGFDTIQLWAWDPCGMYATLIHELMHATAYANDFGDSHDHTYPQGWWRVDGADSIETRGRAYLQQEQCQN